MAYMSQEGYDKLVAELKQLESVERPKASAAIAEARDKGDLSENAEYDAAKEAQAHLEEKINRIKVAISEAKIIDPSRLSTDSVQILSKVEMTNLANKAKMAYTIVSESEANLREGKISITTPIAQGGRRGGNQDSTRHNTPAYRQNHSGIKVAEGGFYTARSGINHRLEYSLKL